MFLAFGFGSPLEIGIIAGVIILLFGGSKIATFGKSLGEGMKEFKKASSELHDEPVSPDPKMAEKPISTVPVETAAHAAETTGATVPTKE